MHIEREGVDRAVEQLRQRQAEPGVTLVRSLEQLTDSVITMFGLTGAGLMLVDDDQLLRSVLATDDLGWVLESSQEKAGEGPCVDTVVHGAVVSTADVVEDGRWPELAPLLADTPIRGVLGVPVRVAGTTVGALNVFVDRPHDWDSSDVDALTTFGHLLEASLSASLLAEQRETIVQQLQEALDSRVVIERCVGLLMGRDGIGAVAAFNALRDLARPSRRKVHEIAREILAEHG